MNKYPQANPTALAAAASFRRKQMRAQRVMQVELARIMQNAKKGA